MKHVMEIHHGYSNCGDGCCSDWYTNYTWDGKTFAWHGMDVGIVEHVLAMMHPEKMGELDPDTEEYYETMFGLIGMDVDVTITDTTSEDMERYDEWLEEFYD